MTSAPMGRIAILAWWLGPIGGVEQFVTDAAIRLSRSGVDVQFITEVPTPRSNQYGKRLWNAGITPVSPHARLTRIAPWLPGLLRRRASLRTSELQSRRKSRLLGILTALPRRAVRFYSRRRLRTLLAARFRTFRPDVLHVHGFMADTAWILTWARTRGLPVIYSEHGVLSEFEGPGPAESTRWLAAADAVLCWPGKARSGLLALDPALENRLHTMSYKVEVPLGSNPSATERLSHIISTARLETAKGIDVLIRALGRVEEGSFNSKLLLFGSGQDAGRFRKLVSELGLEDRVEFRGEFEHSELSQVMMEGDIFVLPSLSDGVSLGVLEAMAYGKAVVATDVGALAEVIRHGKNGLLVPPGDEIALAEALARLLSDVRLRRTLGENASRMVMEGLTSTDDDVIALYTQIRSRHSHRP
ncbi:MAG TPA: glycosyltransferase family 4 protein [Dehalococcoidia bacterium]|nr:glycosyltransferase family 4 protein [Dehalococcoidia bacterium]